MGIASTRQATTQPGRLLLAAMVVGSMLLAVKAPVQAATPVVRVLARGFGQPDDLAWGPHGAIYFSDFGNGAVNLLDSHGRRTIIYAGLRGPEGIVVLPDGGLIVAEQVPNRLLYVDPRRHTAGVLATIPNPSTRAGIDGIARDPRTGALIVPDAPSGRILRVDLAGHVRVLATGLSRPVGAYAWPDGRIVVVDETLNGAFLLGPHGTVQRFGGFLSVPDDVIGDGHGGLYISCLGDGTIRRLAANGATTLVASGLPNPQGLLRRADGSLIVAEESANLLVTVRL